MPHSVEPQTRSSSTMLPVRLRAGVEAVGDVRHLEHAGVVEAAQVALVLGGLLAAVDALDDAVLHGEADGLGWGRGRRAGVTEPSNTIVPFMEPKRGTTFNCPVSMCTAGKEASPQSQAT